MVVHASVETAAETLHVLLASTASSDHAPALSSRALTRAAFRSLRPYRSATAWRISWPIDNPVRSASSPTWTSMAGSRLTTPTGVRLSDRDMPEPDVLVVGIEHRHRLGDRYVEGPPDIVVEVSSPSTRRLDLVRKRRQYERFGVPEYWFVDLDADRIEAYVLEGASYASRAVAERGHTVRSMVLAGLAVEVDQALSL